MTDERQRPPKVGIAEWLLVAVCCTFVVLMYAGVLKGWK